MDELLKKLAEQTGVDVSTATNGFGAILAYLKEHLPAGLFGQVEQSVPETQDAIDSYEQNKVEPSGAGGLVGAAVGMIEKMAGGKGGVGQLATMLSSAGLDLSQIQSFLPKVLELLKTHLPPELLEKITALVLPGAQADSGAVAPATEG